MGGIGVERTCFLSLASGHAADWMHHHTMIPKSCKMTKAPAPLRMHATLPAQLGSNLRKTTRPSQPHFEATPQGASGHATLDRGLVGEECTHSTHSTTPHHPCCWSPPLFPTVPLSVIATGRMGNTGDRTMNFGVELESKSWTSPSRTRLSASIPSPLRIAPAVPDGYIVTRAWIEQQGPSQISRAKPAKAPQRLTNTAYYHCYYYSD